MSQAVQGPNTYWARDVRKHQHIYVLAAFMRRRYAYVLYIYECAVHIYVLLPDLMGHYPVLSPADAALLLLYHEHVGPADVLSVMLVMLHADTVFGTVRLVFSWLMRAELGGLAMVGHHHSSSGSAVQVECRTGAGRRPQPVRQQHKHQRTTHICVVRTPYIWYTPRCARTGVHAPRA